MLVLGVALLAACGGGDRTPTPPATTGATGEGDAAQPVRGGTAVVATATDVRGFNELLHSDSRFTGEILTVMFPYLMKEQPDYAEHPPTFAPQLARSWEWSPDHLTLTVHLRPDLVWSDGEPLTAEDVRWTWQAQIDPDVAWSYANSKAAITAVEGVDPTTVRYRFREVSATQLTDANEGGILPRHIWSKLPFAQWRQNGDWFREHLVVAGAYRLESWKPAQELVLARNERYFEPGLPRLDRVVFRILPDSTTHTDQLLAGNVDFAFGLPAVAAPRVAAAPNARLLVFDNRQYDFIAWNVRRPLFADPEVRRALTQAIDRQALVDALWRGYARVASGPIPANLWAHDAALQPWPFDPAAAKKILADKGWIDHDGDGVLDRGGQPFAFDLTTNSGNQTRADAVVMMQAQLRRIGVDARPRLLEINSLTEKNMAHDFDATFSGWAIDTSLDVRFAFHSAEYDGGYNWGGYANPEVDRLIEEIHRQGDPAAAKPMFDRLQAILHQEQPYTFLWETKRLAGVSSRLHDVRPNALATFFNLHEWWAAPPPH